MEVEVDVSKVIREEEMESEIFVIQGIKIEEGKIKTEIEIKEEIKSEIEIKEEIKSENEIEEEMNFDEEDLWLEKNDMNQISSFSEEVRLEKFQIDKIIDVQRTRLPKTDTTNTASSGTEVENVKLTECEYSVSDENCLHVDRNESHNEQFSEDEISQNEQELIINDEENLGQDNSGPLVRETSQDRDFVLPQGAPKKRGRGGPSQVESNVAKHLKHASDVLTSLANKSQTQQKEPLQDAPALYGQLLAAKFRDLSKRTQLILQNKIDNLVFEEELNEIDYEHSINTPSLINSNNYDSSVSCTEPLYFPRDPPRLLKDQF